jgi:hypothetical protein
MAIYHGMTVKKFGVAAACVRMMKALIMKMDTVGSMKVERVALIGEGRWYLTYFVYELYETNNKICFPSRVYLKGWRKGGVSHRLK